MNHARVCVLMFHRVVDAVELQHDITPQALGELVASLVAEHRLDIDLDLGTSPRSDGCVLTFDDATTDHLPAAEQLTNAGVRGIFYVPTGKVGESGYLTSRDIVSLAEMGHVIGSHCVTHETADHLTDDALARELETSKAYLEDLLASPIRALALPGGVTTPAAASLAQKAGYSSMRLTQWGIYRAEHQRWNIPCVPITRFTMQRGWVQKAARDLRLPPDMMIMGRAKDLLPSGLAGKARAVLHRAPSARA